MTMDYDNMQVLAEVSVTLLGFSGITAIMGYSRFDQRGVTYRMQGLLYTSALALAASILPLVGIPLLHAAIAVAILASATIMWAGKMQLGRSRNEVRPNPFLLWTFLPAGVLVMLSLWWSILISTEYLLLTYQLAIGFNLLLATTYFIRLVASAFPANDGSD